MRRFFEGATQDATGLVHRARTLANPLEGPEDLDPLVDRIGDAACVLLLDRTLNFMNDDSNLTPEGVAARDRLLGDLEAIEQEHRLR